jgi:hypothetical protein
VFPGVYKWALSSLDYEQVSFEDIYQEQYCTGSGEKKVSTHIVERLRIAYLKAVWLILEVKGIEHDMLVMHDAVKPYVRLNVDVH